MVKKIPLHENSWSQSRENKRYKEEIRQGERPWRPVCVPFFPVCVFVYQEPIPYTGLPSPALIQGKEILPQFAMPCFIGTHGRDIPFWAEIEEEWIGGVRVEFGGTNGKRGGRGHCYQIVK